MVLDPETGLTLRQVYEFLDNLVEDNRDSLEELRKAIIEDYEVPDDLLSEIITKIKNEEQLSPNDIRTLARAVGMDYELLTSDKLADDFADRFIEAVNILINIYNQFKPEAQNGI